MSNRSERVRLWFRQYYIPTRYPNGIPGSLPEGLPGPDEAAEAIGIANRVYDLVRDKLAQ